MSIITRLEEIGFSPNESKVIYALGLMKKAKPTEIAKEAGIPYSKIYEILNRLEDKGFIKSNISKPKTYELIDVKLMLDNFIEMKEKELQKIKNAIKSIEIQEFIEASSRERETLGVWIVEGKAARDAELRADYDKAKTEVDVIGDLDLATTVLFDTVKKKLEEGVVFKYLSQDTPSVRERAKKLARAGAQIRLVDPDVIASFKGAVIDGKIAHFTLTNPPKRVCTNYREFASFLKTFFDYWWVRGKPLN